MDLQEALDRLPDSTGAVIILSGGMDSTIAMRLAVEKYGKENVAALSFNYGQKQIYELEQAKLSTAKLGVRHKILNLSILGDISQGFSANVDKNIKMPTIEDVLGDPTPKTYVPYRNLILLSLASAYAEVNKFPTIICGLQVHDEYGYWDTTSKFVYSVNKIVQQNRTFKPTIIAPFVDISKTDEINLLLALDKSTDLLYYTMTCYNPQVVLEQAFIGAYSLDPNAKLLSRKVIESCGKCPSCSERLKAFQNVGIKDPVTYYV